MRFLMMLCASLVVAPLVTNAQDDAPPKAGAAAPALKRYVVRFTEHHVGALLKDKKTAAAFLQGAADAREAGKAVESTTVRVTAFDGVESMVEIIHSPPPSDAPPVLPNENKQPSEEEVTIVRATAAPHGDKVLITLHHIAGKRLSGAADDAFVSSRNTFTSLIVQPGEPVIASRLDQASTKNGVDQSTSRALLIVVEK